MSENDKDERPAQDRDKRPDGRDRRYPSEVHRRQRSKNLALLGVLVALCILFYVMAIVRMGGN